MKEELVVSKQKNVVFSKVLLVAVVSVLLSGCFGFLKPSLTITVDPDPIVFTFDNLTEEKDIEIQFTTKGIGLMKLEQILVELFKPEEDNDDEPVLTEEVAIDITIPVIPGFTENHNDTLNLPEELQYSTEELYEQNLKGKTYTLRLTISGSMDDIIKEVEVKFE